MVYTQAALDSLLACFHFLVFFPLSRWEIFTLLFPTVIPVHLPAKPPGSSTACQIPCAGPLDPTLRLGVHPTALPSTRNFHLVPFFIPTSWGHHGMSGSRIRNSLQALVVPWASSACKNWMLQVMPVHPTPREEVKSPKAVRAVGSAPLWYLGFAASPHPQCPSRKPQDHPNMSLCSATPPAGSYEVPSHSCSIWSCC